MADRKQMLNTLQQFVLPELRKLGFKGSVPHLRRPVGDRLDLLTIQFWSYGGRFIFEIGQCHARGFKTSWGKLVKPEKLNTHYLNQRWRLGGVKRERDHWYVFDGKGAKPVEDVAKQVLADLRRQALPWWDGEASIDLEHGRKLAKKKAAKKKAAKKNLRALRG